MSRWLNEKFLRIQTFCTLPSGLAYLPPRIFGSRQASRGVSAAPRALLVQATQLGKCAAHGQRILNRSVVASRPAASQIFARFQKIGGTVAQFFASCISDKVI